MPQPRLTHVCTWDRYRDRSQPSLPVKLCISRLQQYRRCMKTTIPLWSVGLTVRQMDSSTAELDLPAPIYQLLHTHCSSLNSRPAVEDCSMRLAGTTTRSDTNDAVAPFKRFKLDGNRFANRATPRAPAPSRSHRRRRLFDIQHSYRITSYPVRSTATLERLLFFHQCWY